MTPAARLRRVAELNSALEVVAAAGIRLAEGTLSAAELERRLAERRLGTELAGLALTCRAKR